MNAPLKNEKSRTLDRMSSAVFSLEESKGHLKWKVTDLSRKSNVSRSLIYQYLGGTKKEILVSAFQNFISQFYGFANTSYSKFGHDSISLDRQQMIENPDAILFYQKWRTKDSWLKDEFIKIEKKFQNQLMLSNPDFTQSEILSLHAMIHGLVTAPFLTAVEAGHLFRKIQELLSEKRPKVQ